LKHLAISGLVAMSALFVAQPAVAVAQAPKSSGFTCEAVPEPLVSLNYGSRYTKDSKSRSDIDTASNEEVNKSLKPVETFINDLSRMANTAYLQTGSRDERVACVTDWLAAWADAGALTDLDTMNVRLSTPARFAGLALALLQVDIAGEPDPAKRERIVAWLEKLGQGMVEFFDKDAPTNASKNNLRAWAALAAASIGLAADNEALITWGEQSLELVACAANEDGSLPLEMGRADRALNYQLHAVAPLVVTADLLVPQGFDAYGLCGGKLHKIVEFSWQAAKDPTLVEALNGRKQTFSTGEQKLEPYAMAWADAYLAKFDAPELDAFVAPLREMSHSKLGGNLTLMEGWAAKITFPA
jgi:poly(beta-D-mannuronate) lyase